MASKIGQCPLRDLASPVKRPASRSVEDARSRFMSPGSSPAPCCGRDCLRLRSDCGYRPRPEWWPAQVPQPDEYKQGTRNPGIELSQSPCSRSVPEGRENEWRSRAPLEAIIQPSRRCHTIDPCYNSIRYSVTPPRPPEAGRRRSLPQFNPLYRDAPESARAGAGCCKRTGPLWQAASRYFPDTHHGLSGAVV
jgi:hypothetical protein